MVRVSIIGAGAWGTALAVAAARAHCKTTLWARRASVADDIRQHSINTRYLPGLKLDPTIAVVADLGQALADADIALLAVPAQHLRAICRQAAPWWHHGIAAVACCKGIEVASGALMVDVIAEELPNAPVAILSGPSFAIETARGRPTAVTIACADVYMGQHLAATLKSQAFRPYVSDDPISVAIGGAAKNVLAIGCGIIAGRSLGDNARAALLTRGLIETARLGVVCGGRAETFMGLSGVGDVILTASSPQSRNYSLGIAVGEGRNANDVVDSGSVPPEGIATARAIVALADHRGIETPVHLGVNALLEGIRTIEDVMEELMRRPIGPEFVGLGF